MKFTNILLATTLGSFAAADSDVVGKLVAGYQGWFSCGQDSNDPVKSWVHWGHNDSYPTFELWPDVREYETTYQWDTDAKLGNGQAATLFDSYDDQTVDVHFQWMNKYGIDTAAIQRFGTHVDKGVQQSHLDGVLQKASVAAEKHDVKFYVEWDISGWTNYTTLLPQDWTDNVKSVTSSPAYAKHNGKPVVCVWGFGVSGRPGTGADALKTVQWLKDQGLYVIGGSSAQWRSLTDYTNAFEAMDMVQPWNVGVFSTPEDVANNLDNQRADANWCKEKGIDYQVVVYPGFSWKNLNNGPANQIPRLAGKFMWQQFVNLRTIGVSNAFIAMFDEYDEGTAIAKAAEDSSMAPKNHYFLTLDADGTHVSADFYLRVATDGGKMIKGQTPLVQQCPTKYVL